jgi:hypothetical protein
MEIALFWIIFSVVVGIAAGARARSSGGWCLLALIISPVLALILLVLLPNLKGRPTPATHVKCPDCAELVLKDARVCKHCGCRLTPQGGARQPTDANDKLDDLRIKF